MWHLHNTKYTKLHNNKSNACNNNHKSNKHNLDKPFFVCVYFCLKLYSISGSRLFAHNSSVLGQRVACIHMGYTSIVLQVLSKWFCDRGDYLEVATIQHPWYRRKRGNRKSHWRSGNCYPTYKWAHQTWTYRETILDYIQLHFPFILSTTAEKYHNCVYRAVNKLIPCISIVVAVC